jgi:pimeloyl-ACP methyl ester carboxylesterase
MKPSPRRLRHLLTATALAGLLAGGASAQTCGAAPAASATGPAAPARLAELEYRCLSLPRGGQVLIGQASGLRDETVLLVHGLGQNAHRDWQPALATLARQYRVVTVDLPGFGSSPALPDGYSFDALDAALLQVLKQLGIAQAHVVGHSLGGAVSLHFANRHPERVRNLVLVDAAGILVKPAFMQHLASNTVQRTTGIPGIDRMLRGMNDRLGDMVTSGMEGRFDFTRWLMENPRVKNALIGRYVQVDAGIGLIETDFTAPIRTTRAPTTLIWGRNDPIAPLRTGELLAGRMPDARLQVIDRAGHTPMLESPEAFISLLLRALVSPLPPRTAAPAPVGEARSVECRDQEGPVYMGVYDRITLVNCSRVRIVDARVKGLVMLDSSATIERTTLTASEGAAIDARRSRVQGTVLNVTGPIAIRAEASSLDLAGAQVDASERAVELVLPSTLWFSVSELRAPDYTGDAHFAWPPPGKDQATTAGR